MGLAILLVLAGLAAAAQGKEHEYFRVIELSDYTGMVVRVGSDGKVGPGIAGVKMDLVDPAGNVVRQVETNQGGFYTFEQTTLAAMPVAAPRGDDPVDLSGIVLELRDWSGFVVMTTTTTITGHYQFEVPRGTWEVCVRPETLPAFMQTRTNDFDGVGSEHCSKVLIVSDNNMDQDFGYGP